MARGRLEFLSRDEIQRIHGVSIRILEEVGVAVHCPEAIEVLLQSC